MENEPTLHGFQIMLLKQALADLRSRCPDLVATIDWTGENETTSAGRMPMVEYQVRLAGGRTALSPAIGVAAAPVALARSLRRVLNDRTAEIDSLINKIERCSIT